MAIAHTIEEKVHFSASSPSPKGEHREKFIAGREKTKFVAGSETLKSVTAKSSHHKDMPVAMSGLQPFIEKKNRSFAKIIRDSTNNGLEMVEAVLDVFHRAVERQDDEMTLVSATWLADRGFGKPVQVTQLTDVDGKTMAFTLWQPAPGLQQEDSRVIEALPSPSDRGTLPPLPSAPEDSFSEEPQELPLAVEEDIPDDGYARGVAVDWAKEPRKNPFEY